MKLIDYFSAEQDILKRLAKERERNTFLEAEISYRKEDRILRYTE